MPKKSNSKTLYLGQRKVSDMNFSKFVTLPKAFTNNYLDDSNVVEVRLSAEGTLTLTPVKTNKQTL